MNKNNLWNILLTTLATAILGLLGWILLHVTALEQASARRDAVEFTRQDAAQLQRDITEIVTDVDMRLRLIERDIQWLKGGSMISQMYGDPPQPDPPPLDEEVPSPPPPRYKLDPIEQQER